MKFTKESLKQLISEEIENYLNEGDAGDLTPEEEEMYRGMSREERLDYLLTRMDPEGPDLPIHKTTDVTDAAPGEMSDSPRFSAQLQKRALEKKAQQLGRLEGREVESISKKVERLRSVAAEQTLEFDAAKTQVDMEVRDKLFRMGKYKSPDVIKTLEMGVEALQDVNNQAAFEAQLKEQPLDVLGKINTYFSALAQRMR